MGLMQVILTPFSWLITVFNDLFGNYGAALILFALLVKLILFPFSIKGKRSMIQMNAVSAKVNKLQKMYGNNKEKYNLEVQKLYEKEKVNPMGGCLWSMLPLLILLPLYYIVREPLTYMMSLTADQITALLSALPQTVEQTGPYYQLTAADLLARHFSAVVSSPAVVAFKDSLKALNFSFLGVNLASTPNWKFWADGISWGSVGLFLMPIISAGTSFLFSFISMKTNAVNQQSAQATNSTTKSMMLMSPLISLWIGFAMPASMSIYWIAQNLFSLIQEFLAGRILKKDYEKAAEDAKRREEDEKEEEKRQREIERAERSKRIEEAKNKKKDAKRESDDKISAAVKEASRVGIRAYARGRAYDPNRFSTSGSTAVSEAAPDEPETQETEEK
ncbi:MAG TPA: YidC/Oxa1 family membrane protein insertase [Pseudoflavonifractor sp.]|nr:YidC/Oxa1 family membrane protein insertase [Pseudoflavonifractor sp.]